MSKVYVLKRLSDDGSGPECAVWIYGDYDRAIDGLLREVPQSLTAEVKHVLSAPAENVLEYEFQEPDVEDPGYDDAMPGAVWTLTEQDLL